MVDAAPNTNSVTVWSGIRLAALLCNSLRGAPSRDLARVASDAGLR